MQEFCYMQCEGFPKPSCLGKLRFSMIALGWFDVIHG